MSNAHDLLQSLSAASTASTDKPEFEFSLVTPTMSSRPEPAIIVSSSRRPIQSCAECKRRKIKCNRVIPCEPCTLRGEQDRCREVEKVDPSVTYANVSDVEMLQTRVDSLEAQLRSLNDTVKGLQQGQQPTFEGVSSPRHHAIVRPTLSTSAANSNADPLDLAEARQSHPDEEVALVLEDFAMGHRVNRDRATQRIASSNSVPNAGSSGSQQPYPSPQMPMMSSINLIKESNPLAFFMPAEVDWVRKVLEVFPDPHRSAALVHFYFHKLEWYTKALHKPTYLQDCQRLFSLSPSEAARQMRPSFLAVHAMVLCLALHMIESDVQDQVGFTQEEAAQLARVMFSAAQATLWASDWMTNHSLESLQCIVLMGVYQFNIDEQSDAAWSILGTAIKVAQNIGLHRLGAETEARKQLWPEAWKSFAKREMGRRVWWALVMLDWSHAIAHGGAYTAHPSQMHTAPPSNVNDDDMPVDSPDFKTHPLDRYTESSFSIYKIRFTILYRELIDHLISHSPAQYSFVLNMDMRLVKLIDSLPDHFKEPESMPEDSDLNLVKESILLGIIGETRLLRLHRPYLTRGFKDSKYAPSRDRCVHSARHILSLLAVAGQRCPELLRFWVVIFYCFAAAIVTFVDLTRNPSEDTRELLRQTLILLKLAENVSAAARNAIRLLEGLLSAEVEIRMTQQVDQPAVVKKRKLSSEGASSTAADPFQKAVNRLLLAASSPASGDPASTNGASTSPSSSVMGSMQQPGTAAPSWEGISPSAFNSAFDLLVPPPSAQFSDLDVFINGNGIATSKDGSHTLTATSNNGMTSMLGATPMTGLRHPTLTSLTSPNNQATHQTMNNVTNTTMMQGMSDADLSAAFAADLSHLFGNDFVFSDMGTLS
ncbi:hypothetical protein OIO90_001544 [Microbotryomycetes sp. JL221]|nr:hypothetical protein OIO90_001544 [Microbotryomycetes sp. JL221]